MELQVAATSLHWSQPSVPHSPSSSQTLAPRRCSYFGSDGAVFCRYAEKSPQLFSGQKFSKLYRSRSCDNPRSPVRTIRRAFSASLDSFSDEEFSKKIQELALRFQQSDDDSDDDESEDFSFRGETRFAEGLKPFDAFEPPDFTGRDEIIPANIEMKANSVDIPFSLRIIRRKKQWQEGFVQSGESAYCSVKKAFSSMVFIIRELHSYTLQMREILYFEDLQGILASVQKEMHASFVWLFQKVFSQTPTLMVYVMMLLANYSVYSLSSNAALAAMPPVQAYAAATEEVSVVEDQKFSKPNSDSSVVKASKSSSFNGKTISVGGGGGGKYKSVSSGTDGDDRFDESNYHRTIPSNGVSSLGKHSGSSGEESVSYSLEEEETLWKSVIDEEASKLHGTSLDEALEYEMKQRLVSPVDAKLEADNFSDHVKTELMYQLELAREPNNPLLLANYAQFLYLVAQDFDRAEEFFKRATKVEPKDAEALNKYANFLWVVRKDLWAAEETFLEAISAEPGNSFYAANYAHFLWNTGGEDTCFPLCSHDAGADEM